jgi:hypothetical protein
VTLLHPPYTLWHLSYVAIGAALAPRLAWDRLGLTLLAFLLALGVGAHALDELTGRPLQTRIPNRILWTLAGTSILGAVAIGVVAAAVWTPWLLVFVALGGFIVVAYNLELFGGRFHTAVWFALAWGAFPLLTGYFAVAERLTDEAIVAAGFAALLSHVQRILSTPVRSIRRNVDSVDGSIVYRDGRTEPIVRATIVAAPERALQTLAGATVALACALLLLHLT